MVYEQNKPIDLPDGKRYVTYQKDGELIIIQIKEYKNMGQEYILNAEEIIDLLIDGVKFRILKEAEEIRRELEE